MKANPLAVLHELHFRGSDQAKALPQPMPAGDDFAGTLSNAIDRVDGMQKTANDQIEAFVSGENENLHEVMIAMNEAELSFQLMTEVRNKVLETYQELMRMQV